jgi:hypothetical protein
MRTLLVAAVLFALPAMAETTTTSATHDALNKAAATTNNAIAEANKVVADANAAIANTEKSLTAEQKALVDAKTHETTEKTAALEAAHEAKTTH